MTPDKNQNINLLPADLQRKRAVIKNLVAQERLEYTVPKNGASKMGVNLLANKARGPKKEGFLSRLFGRKKFPVAPVEFKAKPKPSLLIVPLPVQKAKPVLPPPPSAPTVDLKAIAQARLALSNKAKSPKKEGGFLSRLFGRKKSPAAPPAPLLPKPLLPIQKIKPVPPPPPPALAVDLKALAQTRLATMPKSEPTPVLVTPKGMEYTVPKNGGSGTKVNMLSGRPVKSKKEGGFLSRLFGRKKSPAAPLPPQVKPVSFLPQTPLPVQKAKPVPPPPPPAPTVDLKAIAQAHLATISKLQPTPVLASPKGMEYTVPKNGGSGTKVNMLSGRGFLSRLFRRNKSAPRPVSSKLELLTKPAPVAVKTPASALTEPKESATRRSGEPSLDVNLLHEEYAQAFARQNQKSVFLSALGGTFLLIILAFASIHLYQVRSAASARAASVANNKLEATIASYSDLDKNDKDLAKKVLALKSLLDKHISLKAFLEKLEAATIAEVAYLSIAASKDGGITITALAKDYTALARQITVFQEATPWVRSAAVASATLSRDTQGQVRGIEFDITLMVDPAVFAASQ